MRLHTPLRALWVLLFVSLLASPARAFHIAGAELTYECLGNDRYELTLTFFRDCSLDNSGLPVAGFDDPLFLYIFFGNGQNLRDPVFNVLSVPAPQSTPELMPPDIEECGGVPPSVCIQRGVYKTQVVLPARPGGYDIGWARCCRNQGITNLTSPDDQGLTMLSHVPGTNEVSSGPCNSMPEFKQPPPLFLCLDRQLTWDHSAVEPDGDSLVYEIADPFTGLNANFVGADNNNPAVQPGVNPMGPPPYQNVDFSLGFNFQNAFGGTSTYQIDRQTGELTIQPRTTGLFVFAISVKEYRNGTLISENKRDYQVFVLPCSQLTDLPEINHDFSQINADPNVDVSTNQDTILVPAKEDFCFETTVQDTEPNTVLQVTEDIPPALQVNRTVVAPNQIDYDICWRPGCNRVGGLFPVAFQAIDTGDCRFFQEVTDTLWVKVLPVPGNEVEAELIPTGGFPVVGDTVENVPLNDTACFDFEVSTPNTSPDSIDFSVRFNAGGNQPFITDTTHTANSIRGELCWRAGCNGVDQPVRIIVRGTKENGCPPGSQDADTSFVRVFEPPNPPPELSAAFQDSNLNVSGDTVIVIAQDSLCASFKITDSLGSTNLTNDAPSVEVRDPASGQVASPGPSLSPLNITDSAGLRTIAGEACWTSTCNFVGDTAQLIFSITEVTDCGQSQTAADTLHIIVQPPPNPPPDLSSSFQDSAQNLSGDTLTIFPDSNFCASFQITDSLNTTNLNSGATVEIVDPQSGQVSSPGPNLSPINITDSAGLRIITGEACWTTTCNFLSDTALMIFEVTEFTDCNIPQTTRDTLFIRVVPPPNPPPELISDFADSTQTIDGDTIRVIPDENLCADFLLVDSLNSSNLTSSPDVRILNPTTGQPLSPPPNIGSVTITDSAGLRFLEGQVCWNTLCGFFGQKLLMEFTGTEPIVCGGTNEVRDTLFIDIQRPPNPRPTLTTDLSGTGAIGDTIRLRADSTTCYDFSVLDSTPASNLFAEARVEVLGGGSYLGPPANLNVDPQNADTLLTGNVCLTGRCVHFEDTLMLILTAIDSVQCVESHRLEDTTFLIITQPPNFPPELSVEQGGQPAADTLDLIAEDTTCLDFSLSDTLVDAAFGADHLQLEFEMLDLAGNPLGANAPFIDTVFAREDTLLSGRLCWAASCTNINETVLLRLTGVDSATCTREHEVVQEIYINVQPKPTDPISLEIDAQSVDVRGDTLVFRPKQGGCANVRLEDFGNQGELSLTPVGDIFGQNGFAGPAATLSDTSGNTLIDAQFCWQPGCAQKSPGLWPVTFRGRSVIDCSNPVEVDTTIYIKVEEPDNNPPQVTIENAPPEFVIGQDNCFQVRVRDPDDFAILGVDGLSESFAEDFGSGGNVRITQVDTLSNTELLMTLCIQPNCNERLEPVTVTVGAFDSTRCDTTLAVTESTTIPVSDCNLQMPNVFTPNGDGINDDFGPLSSDGVQSYQLQVYDRWGQLQFRGRNEGWPGTADDGGPAPAGTYMYIINYTFYSGTGEPIRARRSGSVTLLR